LVGTDANSEPRRAAAALPVGCRRGRETGRRILRRDRGKRQK